MRTRLLSLKTLLVICLMAIVGGVETWADTYKYTFTSAVFKKTSTTSKENLETQKLGDVSWTTSGVIPYVDVTGYDANKGQQFGSQRKPADFSISTSYVNGTITSIKINASKGKNGSSTLAVSVGGNQYGKDVSLTNSATNYSFEGSSSGEVKISIKSVSIAAYIKSIEITYTSSSSSSVAAPTITPTSKEFAAPFTATIASTTKDATIYYTLDGSDPIASKTRQTYTSAGVSIPAVTTTLKACASLNGKNSSVASATYTYTEQGDAPIVIWSENWSTFKKEDKPTQGENATYVCKDGASVTQIYDDALAGGESPELLINKKGGSLAITIKNLKGANEGLMFTFKTNQDNNKFSVSTENVSILKSDIIDNGTNSSNKKVFIWKYVMALNEGATSLTITLNNASSENFRVDDLELSTYSGVGSFKITEAGYGTYYSSKAYTMPKGVKGYTITGNEGTSLVMNEAYAAGAVVPAKTALVVEGAANKYYTLVAESTDLTPDNNKLHGSDEAETTYVDGTDVKYYKLSYNNEGNNLGFYWGSENGAAFTNGAHKAYLALDSETLLSQSRGFSLADLAHGVTTGINTTVKSATQSNFIYDLNGRRINSLNGAAKGVYIMNGQKVLVK